MRSRSISPWLLVVVLVIVGGILSGAGTPATNFAPSLIASQSTQPSPAPEDKTKQAVPALQKAVKYLQTANKAAADEMAGLQRQLSSEQEQRRSLSDQVSVLQTRVDGLEEARAEYSGPARRHHRRR